MRFYATLYLTRPDVILTVVQEHVFFSPSREVFMMMTLPKELKESYVVLDADQKPEAWIAACQRGGDYKAAFEAYCEAAARRRKTSWCLPAHPST